MDWAVLVFIFLWKKPTGQLVLLRGAGYAYGFVLGRNPFQPAHTAPQTLN